jgi:hypothetical protein
MSLEDKIDALTAAIKENTAAHEAMTQVAVKAAGSKSTAKAETKAEETDTDTDEDDAAAKKKAAAEKRKAAAAKKKKEEAAKKAAEESEAEIVTEISKVDLHAKAKEFMSSDDSEERDAAKANFASALEHLGAAKLSEVDDDDRARLATYINAWSAGSEKIDFEDLDEKIAEAGEDMLD